MGNGTDRGTDERPRVVVGVDGSPPARAALVTAFAAAARHGAELEVVAVYRLELYGLGGVAAVVPDIAGLRAETEKLVRDLIQEVRSDPTLAAVPGVDEVPVSVVISAEPPVQELVERSAGAQLLVVGNRGRGAVRSALLGSVALHCVTHAACPVLVVHGTPLTGTAGRIVAGVDGSAASASALATAVQEADRLGAEVEVVSTFTLANYWSDQYSVVMPTVDQIRAPLAQQVDRMVAAVLEKREGGGVPAIRTQIMEGPAAEMLVRRAEGADLLVVGSRGHGTLRGLLLGSVALHCAMHAPCPVLIVHPRA